MCGIAGFCNHRKDFLPEKPYWEAVSERMRATLFRRGDDEHGVFVTSHVGLAHSRLSIRDLAKGRQPMTKFPDGAPVSIVYNGEIYNTDELSRELEAAGYRFDTTSDTEVILSAYLCWGEDFVTRLNGIFAFAIWDGRVEKLLLYRDRVGVKPLFYGFLGDAFLFGSEPKALFSYPGFSPEIDRKSLQEVLAIGPAVTPGKSVFSNVAEIKPGHFGIFSADGFSERTYWELSCVEHTDTYAQTVEKVRFLVEDAVTRQMVSDVPVCSFLSGGIDSSIVTAIAANVLAQKGKTLNTFSFDFKENDKYFQSNSFQPERDLPYVNKMLDFCATNHTYLECDEQQLFDHLFTAVDAKDAPGMTDVDASLLYFCSLVKEHNKVTLTGECADEIFGGYPWFYRKELLEKDGFPWSADVTPRTVLLSDEALRSLDLQNYSHFRYEESVARTPHLDGETPEEFNRRNISYLNIKWFMQTLLNRMDRTSMYSGLEARVPFADHRIIEYVFCVPWSMKFQNGVEKALLRDACKDLLPPELLHRKKSPYPKTYHPGYEKLLSDKLRQILDTPSSPVLPLLDRERTLRFLKSPAEYGKPWFGQLMAAPQLMAYVIQINDWLEKYGLSVTI